MKPQTHLNKRLVTHLENNRSAIINAWFKMAVDTYPADTARFLKQQKDPFANPVGNTTLKGLEALFKELLNGMDPDTLKSFLDPIIRIRAVQGFQPSQATGFILFLKTIIREQLKKDLENPQLLNALLEFELNIDKLNQIGFDLFVECREKIYQIKAREEQNRTYRAFERAGLIDHANE